MQVIHFVIHMFIIWLGYTYRTLAKLYLLSCSHCLASFYFSKCPPPAAMQFAALAFMSIIALLTIAGSICATSLEILQQNLPGAQAESSWYPSSCGTPLQERIAEAERIAALEASLFWNHYLGQKNTTLSLKNSKAIWDKFITCTHTFTCCQRRAWCFTCICKSFIWISHCQE